MHDKVSSLYSSAFFDSSLSPPHSVKPHQLRLRRPGDRRRPSRTAVTLCFIQTSEFQAASRTVVEVEQTKNWASSTNCTTLAELLQCKMPRRPRTHCQQPRTLPFTFSPFARALARMASPSMPKRQHQHSKFDEKPTPASKSSLKEKAKEYESSDEEFEGVVQADFSFFDPKPNDFHGVKTLLQTYLDDKEWDLSGFVDLILAQTTVGTVVKIEDDEDEGLFAVVSALNLWRYREQKCITEVKDFLLSKTRQEKGITDKLRLLLEEQARDIGLLVSQRVLNLPPQLLPHLYEALFDEVSWATEDEHKNIVKKRKPSSDDDEAIIYVKPEDEIFHKLKNYRPMGLIMAVEAGKIPAFRQELGASLISIRSAPHAKKRAPSAFNKATVWYPT
ncbi:hypothetical protein Ahy_B03g064074 isoform F [Arachis hypogaea]|uniref:Protein BCCIP homolog n=1 Tax=Arachis hypogaea TaxID=3818 RepID=A0A444ZYL5_ARAHY|nr:hypothetical protein Ahy_B03g064074 isoform F [Arachis hypogaea]